MGSNGYIKDLKLIAKGDLKMDMINKISKIQARLSREQKELDQIKGKISRVEEELLEHSIGNIHDIEINLSKMEKELEKSRKKLQKQMDIFINEYPELDED